MIEIFAISNVLLQDFLFNKSFQKNGNDLALLLHNIQFLVHTEDAVKERYCGTEMGKLKNIEHAYLLIDKDKIADFGTFSTARLDELKVQFPGLETIDVGGGSVFPAWCDAHTHIVYAGSREKEFVDRINGLSYQEIAARGGGILNSAARLRQAGETELLESATARLNEVIRMGTGAIEIKSGYGLDEESELKMLRVIRELDRISAVTIKATFLGAHAVPTEYKNDKAGYIRLLTDRLLPRIAEEQLADYCDVFCENGYFTKTETLQILETAQKLGLRTKVHAEQLSHSGGIEAGVATNAISVDHLEYISDNDIELLRNSGTMPVFLPGAQLFLGLPSPPARKMIEAGLPVAICSDFNPGSCPSGNMNQMVSLACILYKMTPAEAIMAATTNSAYAMELSNNLGSIAVGKKANLFITAPLPSPDYLPYYFGVNPVKRMMLSGVFIN
jgi:imidazolonepropionase